MTFLERIDECNDHDTTGFVPVTVAGIQVGWARREFVAHLKPYPEAFEASPQAVKLAPGRASPEDRTQAVDAALQDLANKGVIAGWRDEYYAVGTGFDQPPLMKMERSAVPYFGITAYGVHVNGYVRRAGGGIDIWVARRAAGKQTFAGMLDNLVAGGLAAGMTAEQVMIKEAAEEAAIPEALARTARPVGAVTYRAQGEEGLKPDVLFVFDLELPGDFIPRNTDGEIAEFYLWPAERVMERVAETREFKFNCNLIVIDFCIRHGLIRPDHPDYIEIVRGLRR